MLWGALAACMLVVRIAPATYAIPPRHVDLTDSCIRIVPCANINNCTPGADAAVATAVATWGPHSWTIGKADNATHRCTSIVLLSMGARGIGAAGSFRLQMQVMLGMLRLDATDAAGLYTGAGRLLRELHMPARASTTGGTITIPQSVNVSHDAANERWKVRGVQLYVDSHPLQFRTAAELTTYTHDLAVFGTNMLEMSHLLFPSTGARPLKQVSIIAAAAGMNVSMWIGVQHVPLLCLCRARTLFLPLPHASTHAHAHIRMHAHTYSLQNTAFGPCCGGTALHDATFSPPLPLAGCRCHQPVGFKQDCNGGSVPRHAAAGVGVLSWWGWGHARVVGN
jgi:hypothetical protein